MPVSRGFIVALGIALLALVGFFATASSRQGEDVDPVVEQPPAAQAPEAAKGPKADKVAKASRSEASARRGNAGMPREVRRALAARRTLVLFFYKPGSADDAATARAVNGLRGLSGVSVVSSPIGRLAAFRGIVDALGIGQAPAVVIVDRARKARLIEGYVDPKTLRQDVADMR